MTLMNMICSLIFFIIFFFLILLLYYVVIGTLSDTHNILHDRHNLNRKVDQDMIDSFNFIDPWRICICCKKITWWQHSPFRQRFGIIRLIFNIKDSRYLVYSGVQDWPFWYCVVFLRLYLKFIASLILSFYMK